MRQPIDIKSLENYIDSNVPAIRTPISLKQFGFGQSNPTYQITDAKQSKFVMRKKPPGKLVWNEKIQFWNNTCRLTKILRSPKQHIKSNENTGS